MNFSNVSIGNDIEQVSRFEGKTLENSRKFLEKIFTFQELEYCFLKKFPAQSLAARFCAKEAVVKALHGLNIKGIYYKDIEIINKVDGCPVATISKLNNIKIKISFSHTKDYASATALIYKGE